MSDDDVDEIVAMMMTTMIATMMMLTMAMTMTMAIMTMTVTTIVIILAVDQLFALLDPPGKLPQVLPGNLHRLENR